MDKAPQTLSTTLLGPLEEEIWVEEGEILEAEEVILEETQEEVAETPLLHTTSFQGNSSPSSKEIAKSRKHSYKNGISTEGSIVSPLKL